MFYGIEIVAIVGFLLASYAIVANDVIQTLGTFLSSNSRVPWWVMWLFACGILVAIMLWGWFGNSGDIAFDRLDKIGFPPASEATDRPAWLAAIDPPGGVEWYHVLPPLALLVLTRYGIPVSTTFLVLTIFIFTAGGSGETLPQMLTKSFVGYLVAFGSGLLIFLAISRFFERWVHRTQGQPVSPVWTVLQWCSTAFLWSQWLIQDLANIFVFLPRTRVEGPDGSIQTSFDPGIIIFGTVVMLALHAFIFATRGGQIQKIVLTKTNTTDIRSATAIDFTYGMLLWYFKELNDLPMSTTWVFLGLLAGRELGVTLMLREARPVGAAMFDVVSDVLRALMGLLVSIFLAIAIPRLAGAPAVFELSYLQISALFAATLVCFGLIWILRRHTERANAIPAAGQVPVRVRP